MNLFNEHELAQVLEAVRDGQLLASAEWLTANDARLLAGRCSRTMLDAAAAAGVIVRRDLGDKPVYQRASINAAIADGRWHSLKELTAQTRRLKAA